MLKYKYNFIKGVTMTLYIEHVIVDNFVVDYMLLGLISTCSKQKIRFINRFFSCLLGTISAIFLPFVLKFNILAVIYKILTALLMVLIIQTKGGIKRYIYNLSLHFLFTFVFAGAMLCVLNLFQIKYTLSGVLLYNFEFPMSLFLILFYAGFWLMKKVIVGLGSQLKMNNYTCEITLVDGDKQVNGIGLLDSGNMLNVDGVGVSIISMDMFFKLHSEYSINKFLFKNLDTGKLQDANYIAINGVSNNSKCLAFKLDKLIINGKEYYGPTVAVPCKNFKNYDCILSNTFMEGENGKI